MFLVLLFGPRLGECGRNEFFRRETWPEERYVLFGGFLKELRRLCVKEEVFEDKIDQEEDGRLSKNEALGKRWCQGEDVVAHWYATSMWAWVLTAASRSDGVSVVPGGPPLPFPKPPSTF